LIYLKKVTNELKQSLERITDFKQKLKDYEKEFLILYSDLIRRAEKEEIELKTYYSKKHAQLEEEKVWIK